MRFALLFVDVVSDQKIQFTPVRTFFTKNVKHLVHCRAINPVVRIDDANVCARGNFQTGIDCATMAFIFLVDSPHAGRIL